MKKELNSDGSFKWLDPYLRNQPHFVITDNLFRKKEKKIKKDLVKHCRT